MKPAAGHDYLEIAACLAAEASAGVDTSVGASEGFAKSVDPLVYYIDPGSEEMKVAYPDTLLSSVPD
eukprot:11661102-Alexandrium_andersonii.AAC.1